MEDDRGGSERARLSQKPKNGISVVELTQRLVLERERERELVEAITL
jgi:hypothetical protein